MITISYIFFKLNKENRKTVEYKSQIIKFYIFLIYNLDTYIKTLLCKIQLRKQYRIRFLTA